MQHLRLGCLLLVWTLSGQAEEVTIQPIPQAELLQYLAGKSDFTLLDARSPEEYAAGHVWGAINLPHDAALDEAPGLPQDLEKPLVVYCKSGLRALTLQRRLQEAGYSQVRMLAPGQMLWAGEDLPVFNCGAEPPQAQVINTADTPLSTRFAQER